jgi:hypothetical protein
MQQVGDSPVEQALLRSLRLALPDDKQARGALAAALAASRRAELPQGPDELFVWARTYLAPSLTRSVAPNLVLAMLDDLAAHLEDLRQEGASGGTRMRATTRLPPSSGEIPAERLPPERRAVEVRATEDRRPTARIRFPRLGESVAHLVRTVSTSLKAVTVRGPPLKSAPSGVRSKPVSLVLVAPDRLERASLARVLVNARFEVAGVDGIDRLEESLRGQKDRRVIVVFRTKPGTLDGIGAVADAHSELPVFAWSDQPYVDETRLRAAGFRHCASCAKDLAQVEIVDAIRQFVARVDEAESRGAVQGRGRRD